MPSRRAAIAALAAATTTALAKNEKNPPTALVYDPLFLQHKTPPGHPETPQRLKSVVAAIEKSKFSKLLLRAKPKPANSLTLTACHKRAYLRSVVADVKAMRSRLSTGDTPLSPRSLEVAQLAAGGACTAVDLVMKNRAKNAFCLLRPPGHHATPKRGMGFCIYNNVAIAARYAQSKHKIGKVLIVDWDVHHGNGTQDIFYDDPSVFFFSVHQSPWYPGTGAKNETGQGKGLGSTMNRPFPAGAGRKQIHGAFTKSLMPALQRFRPELILISAGFDSRINDPLGRFRLTDKDFVELTDLMLKAAKQFCQGRLVSILEGGYNLTGLASAATAHCQRLHQGA